MQHEAVVYFVIGDQSRNIEGISLHLYLIGTNMQNILNLQ